MHYPFKIAVLTILERCSIIHTELLNKIQNWIVNLNLIIVITNGCVIPVMKINLLLRDRF